MESGMTSNSDAYAINAERYTSQTCAVCGRALDPRHGGACWTCRTRPCADCGWDTGSPMVIHCGICRMAGTREER